jgi:hypothetical protein
LFLREHIVSRLAIVLLCVRVGVTTGLKGGFAEAVVVINSFPRDKGNRKSWAWTNFCAVLRHLIAYFALDGRSTRENRELKISGRSGPGVLNSTSENLCTRFDSVGVEIFFVFGRIGLRRASEKDQAGKTPRGRNSCIHEPSPIDQWEKLQLRRIE